MMKKLLTTVAAAAICASLAAETTATSVYTKCNWLNDATCAITLTFDDGLANQFSTMVPLLDNYGLKGTFYIVTDWAERDGIWPEIKRLSDNGHEIGSHTLTHPTISGLDELVRSKQILEQKTGKACLTVAYPYCNLPTDPAANAALEENYISGRTCSGQLVAHNTTDMYNISSIVTGTEGRIKTSDDMQGMFENARDEKRWCVFLTHEINKGSGYSPTQSREFKKALIYLRNNPNSYWVATFADVSKYIRENRASAVTELSATQDRIIVSVTNKLDSALYNFPITIRRTMPDGWSSAEVTQNGEVVKSWTDKNHTCLYFNVVPGAGDVTIFNGAMRVHEIYDESGDERMSITFSDDFITVNSDAPASRLELSDMSGRVVFSSSDGNVISVRKIQGGSYVLRAFWDDNTLSARKLHLSAR